MQGGKLSNSQAEIECGKLMRKLDVNGDGQIIFEEFEQFFMQRAAQVVILLGLCGCLHRLLELSSLEYLLCILLTL